MIPDTKKLVTSARRALWKMKREYDRLQPDAEPDECWAEAESLDEALKDFDKIYPDFNVPALRKYD